VQEISELRRLELGIKEEGGEALVAEEGKGSVGGQGWVL